MARILLVDDDESFRKMLGIALATMQHEVIQAANGREASRRLLNFSPELVITDIMMPEKDGLELVPEIRKKNPDSRIIAMSGGGRVNASDFLQIAKLLGADAILTKPFSLQQLAETINDLCGGKQI